MSSIKLMPHALQEPAPASASQPPARRAPTRTRTRTPVGEIELRLRDSLTTEARTAADAFRAISQAAARLPLIKPLARKHGG